jgi:hypothetical protein
MADLLANEGIHIHQHQASKGDASSDPSKPTSRDIEARSPLDAIDIITTGSQEIENVERHKKTGAKAISRYDFSSMNFYSAQQEIMIQKSMLLTTAPHTSKVKVSSDQPWQKGVCKVTHDDFRAINLINGIRAKLCFF